MNKSIEPTTEKSYRRASYFLALGHFITDLYPGFLAPLLPVLIDKFKISFTSASILAVILTSSASLTQPVIGHLYDRIGGRRMIILGPLIAGLSLSFIGRAHHLSVLIVLLVLGGLGVASFHPEAAALTTQFSGRKKTWGISVFMLGGNFGFGIGPFVILTIVTLLGFEWSIVASLPALCLGWILYRHVPIPEKLPESPPASEGAHVEPPLKGRALRFAMVWSIVVLRAMTVMGLLTFLPILQNLRGFSLVTAGSSNSVFMVCGSMGGLIGGYLADRVGRKKLTIASFIPVIPAFAAFLHWKGPASFFILAFLGFLLFVSESACIVLAQDLIPKQARTASGLIMGMAWGSAGLAVLGTGALADSFGIEGALWFLLFLPAAALLLSFLLPRDR
jgi:MFS transporter, FSR family, fosmidomycin resistance protein